MIHSSASSRGKRRLGTAATAAAAALLTLLLTATVALSWDGSVPAPPDSPTSADQIQNLDQVKTAIKAYYGDTTTGQLDPVAGTTALHTFSPTGAYANEMAGLEADAAQFLAKEAKPKHHDGSANGDPAGRGRHDPEHLQLRDLQQLRLQPDDQCHVREQRRLPGGAGYAGPGHAGAGGGLHDLLPHRAGRDSAGRHDDEPRQRRLPGGPAEDLYLKDQVEPALAVQLLAGVLDDPVQVAHPAAQSLGYDIVANFGDQFSDLNGGFADRTSRFRTRCTSCPDAPAVPGHLPPAGGPGRRSPALPLGGRELRVVVRAEEAHDVRRAEELDARSGTRRRDDHDEVSALSLEAPVSQGVPALVL